MAADSRLVPMESPDARGVSVRESAHVAPGRSSCPVRIGILTQYYPPEMGAPQARLSHLAGELARAGHEVVVLTAMPNYPQGRVFDGYGGFRRTETRDGVRVIRSWLHPTREVGLRKRLASYGSFAFSSLVAGSLSLRRLDYLITESPPLFLGPTGYLLSRRLGARWIFNVSDLWPESAVHLGAVRDGWGVRAAYALEAFCYRKAWLVTGQSKEILENIQRRFPSVPTYHLSNGVDTDFFRPERRTPGARSVLLGDGATEKSCVALYGGLHGIAQGLDQILDAADRLKDVPGLSFVLIGDGAEKPRLLEKCRTMGLPNVRFLDARPREEMPALLASADVAIVPLKMMLPGAVPSKIYEAMGAGVPMVLVAEGEAAHIVQDTGAGMVVAPGDVDGLADALRKLAGSPELRDRLGRAGRDAAVERFDRRRIAGRFRERLEKGDS